MARRTDSETAAETSAAGPRPFQWGAAGALAGVVGGAALTLMVVRHQAAAPATTTPPPNTTATTTTLAPDPPLPALPAPEERQANSEAQNVPPWQPADQPPLEVIDSLPPPPRVEDQPTSPSEQAVWVGGSWDWNGDWVWRDGNWMIPPGPQETYAPPYYEPRGGVLLYIPGFWLGPGGRFVPPPPGIALPAPLRRGAPPAPQIAAKSIALTKQAQPAPAPAPPARPAATPRPAAEPAARQPALHAPQQQAQKRVDQDRQREPEQQQQQQQREAEQQQREAEQARVRAEQEQRQREADQVRAEQEQRQREADQARAEQEQRPREADKAQRSAGPQRAGRGRR